MRQLVISALVAGLALSLFTAGGALAQQSSSSAVAITEKDDGKTMSAAVGQTVIVQLPSNPTTGYTWILQSSTVPLRLVKQHYSPWGPNMPGAGGTETFDLVANNAGTADVRIDYRRPWEKKDVAASKTFQVKVDVK